ncbi:MAG: PRC-barrel domain-containing protein [Gemmatimonadetes bacterium]|nr:PRC-barrel domain-containing protein [Gemmatimonadota bacterium]
MAKDKDRARRDQAGVGPALESSMRNLVPMHELEGFTIADGEPDIRGWDVRTLNGRDVGEIQDLLIDAERREVVMVEVQLRDGNARVEVPIRSVQLDREGRRVIVDSSDIDALRDDRPDDRLNAAERSELNAARDNAARTVTYGALDEHPAGGRTGVDGEETVVERRPVIEEVVVRRRVVDEE